MRNVIAAGITSCQVRPGCFRQRRKPFLLNRDFYFLTLHGPSPREIGAGWPPRSTSIELVRVLLCPTGCPYSSLISLPSLGFCSMPFLPSLLPNLLLEQVPKPRTRLV